jgi:hypothetical protein
MKIIKEPVEEFAFPELSQRKSLTTLCAHFFEPRLIPSFISFREAGMWCLEYVENVLFGRLADAGRQYTQMETKIAPHLRRDLSMANPPYSIASSDLRSIWRMVPRISRAAPAGRGHTNGNSISCRLGKTHDPG